MGMARMGVSKRTSKKNVHFKFYSKFYIECEMEFDSLGQQHKECLNKSLTS